MNAAFYTLGCRLNQLETEALVSAFRNQGFFIVPWEEEADIYIINTCTVTSKSEQKARRMIRKISGSKSNTPIIVTGCYAQMERGSLLDLGNNVVVVPLDDKDIIQDLAVRLGQESAQELLRLTEHWVEEHLGLNRDPQKRFRFEPEQFTYHSRAFLKVQDGCDNSCSYCRVTLARGESVSLDGDEIIRRLQRLCASGFKEVVLTGVNIDSYRWKSLDLPGLLRKILSETKGFRIRLSSLEPQTITEEFASVVSHDRICPYFHLSLQSGSDRILKKMNRGYEAQDVIHAVSHLRKAKGNPFIAADVIVGFPGEQESDFQESCRTLKEANFQRAHVFPYSSRPGTAAAEMKDSIANEVITRRAELLRTQMADQQNSYIKHFLGEQEELLIEQQDETSIGGTTGNYLSCQVEGTFSSNLKGTLLPVKITSLHKGILKAQLINH